MNIPKIKSFWGLGFAILLVCLWLISGYFKETEEVKKEVFEVESKFFKVQIEQLYATNVEKTIEISSITIPTRSIELKVETQGTISAIKIERGSLLEAGDLIATIDLKDRPYKLAEAYATLRQREQEYEAHKELAEKDFLAEVKLTESLAMLETARANVNTVEEDIKATEIKAPFSGKLQERNIELGDYVKTGDKIGEIVELNPLAVKGHVIETDIKHINKGMTAFVKLISGKILEGHIRYVAPSANLKSRTFQVEASIDNPKSKYSAGVTATIIIPLGEILAYKISAALLTLDKNGDIGVKLVDNQNIVKFKKIEIVKSEENYLWITGLPQSVNLITIGQDFVKDGEQVIAIKKDSES